MSLMRAFPSTPTMPRFMGFLALRSSPSQIWRPFTSSSFSLSSAIYIPGAVFQLPGILSDIWDSVLRAVPKKKTSHMKKRHRQMAGKALKDVTNLNTCSGCGQSKRAHTLCPVCVGGKLTSARQIELLSSLIQANTLFLFLFSFPLLLCTVF